MFGMLFRLLHKMQLRAARENGLQCGVNLKCQGSVSFGSEPYLIKIGDHVSISFGVSFITHDGGTWLFRDAEKCLNNIGKFGPIVIKDNCFIGARSIILPNVSIGPNAIIGAGSVVTKDVPSDNVWAGVPARHISTLQEYKEKLKVENQRINSSNKEAELRKLFSNLYN